MPVAAQRRPLLTSWRRTRPRLSRVPAGLLAGAGEEHPAGEEPAAPGLQAPPLLDVLAIRRSVKSIRSSPQKVAGDFYGYLFTASPGLREMFPPVMREQNERLFAALVRVVSMLDTPDRLARYLSQLGADHRKYAVRPEHYAPVGDALIRTLRRHCEAWDDRAEAAWLAAYGVAAAAMIDGAETSDGPPYWHGRVARHEMRGADLAVLHIETSEPLPYEPGQYITLQTAKWPRVWRAFSVANSPVMGTGTIELHVRRVPGGWVSTALTRDLHLGSEVILGPPAGSMTSEPAGGRDLLLVAGGVGLAPMKALAEDVLARDEAAQAGGWGARRNIALFHGARTALGLYGMPQLRELERTFPWLSVIPAVSDEPAFAGARGSVTDVALGHAEWLGREAYLAGPPDMINGTARKLIAAGMPEERVHFDDPGAG
jgi:NAD(P)H-flavin reductase/hemoglobin-like flavoprotein